MKISNVLMRLMSVVEKLLVIFSRTPLIVFQINVFWQRKIISASKEAD